MVPQGMGFECSAIHQSGRSNPLIKSRIKSGGRAIGIAWKAIGWFATADRDRGLPPIKGCLTRAASGARSKRDGTARCGDRHVRHPPSSADREVPFAYCATTLIAYPLAILYRHQGRGEKGNQLFFFGRQSNDLRLRDSEGAPCPDDAASSQNTLAVRRRQQVDFELRG